MSSRDECSSPADDGWHENSDRCGAPPGRGRSASPRSRRRIRPPVQRARELPSPLSVLETWSQPSCGSTPGICSIAECRCGHNRARSAPASEVNSVVEADTGNDAVGLAAETGRAKPVLRPEAWAAMRPASSSTTDQPLRASSRADRQTCKPAAAVDAEPRRRLRRQAAAAAARVDYGRRVPRVAHQSRCGIGCVHPARLVRRARSAEQHNFYTTLRV